MHEQSEAAAVLPEAASDATPAANDALATQTIYTPTFSGSGKEYFRIWLVNLMLSVATLGIYSAWAKVRRLQYFDRNTQLAGASFDFHGDPKAILKGRLMAMVLLFAYHYAFGFSKAFGFTVIGVLFVALPMFMRGALRFRLQNTAYRGLRFSFGGSTADAYKTYLPLLLALLLPAVLLAIDSSGKLMVAGFLLYLGWPLMHGAMRQYQHSHLQYGGLQSSYDVRPRSFYPIYFKCLGLALAAFVIVLIVFALGAFVVTKGAGDSRRTGMVVGMACMAAFLYIAYLFAGPYVQARVGNLAWSHTRFPDLEIRSSMSARALIWLQTKNVVLTLLTLGLYRPFAVVKLHRFRLANITLHAPLGLEHIATQAVRPAGAAGDSIADFFGIDLSW